jgi:hypothetical protein
VQERRRLKKEEDTSDYSSGSRERTCNELYTLIITATCTQYSCLNITKILNHRPAFSQIINNQNLCSSSLKPRSLRRDEFTSANSRSARCVFCNRGGRSRCVKLSLIRIFSKYYFIIKHSSIVWRFTLNKLRFIMWWSLRFHLITIDFNKLPNHQYLVPSRLK